MATRIDILAAAAALSLAACAPETKEPAPELTSNQHEIVRGAEAVEGQLMSTVALVDSGAGEFFCTGTLVSPTVVVTAAHCFMNEDESGWIDAGDAAIGFATLGAVPVARERRRAIERFTVHPGFSLQGGEAQDETGVGQDNDIAVVILNGPVDAQQPTALLPGERLAEMVPGAELTISGYGVTDLDPARDAAGRLHIGQTTLIQRSAHELLAGGNAVADTCNGDSGGPAYLVVEGRRYLAGVTSRAAHDAREQCGDRGIYTLVTPYIDWIAEIVANGPAAREEPPALDGNGWGEGIPGEGDGEPGVDVCEEEGFYGDDVCDEFCDRPDPDCNGAPGEREPGDGEPGVDVCEEEGWYGDNECDEFCDRPDPDCGEVPEEPEPEDPVEQPEPEDPVEQPEAEKPDEEGETPWGPPLEEGEGEQPAAPDAPVLEREPPNSVAPVDSEGASSGGGCNAAPGAPQSPLPAFALILLGLGVRRFR